MQTYMTKRNFKPLYTPFNEGTISGYWSMQLVNYNIFQNKNIQYSKDEDKIVSKVTKMVYIFENYFVKYLFV